MPSQVDNYSILERVQEVAGARYLRAEDVQHAREALLIVVDTRRSASRTEQIQFTQTRAESWATRLHALTTHQKIAPFRGPLRSELGVAYGYRQGIPLSAWRARYGHATQYDAISLGLEVLDVLAFAHDVGVLHRALSPAMIWVEDAPALRLCAVYGFGFAALLEAERTWSQTATVQTDVQWMAAEQFTGEPLTPGTDLYSVGLLLHFLLSDIPAIEGASVFERVQRHCEGQCQPISPKGRASVGLRAIVARVLRRASADRFGDAREMAHALREELPRATRSLPQVEATRPQFVGEVSRQPASPPPSKAEALGGAREPSQSSVSSEARTSEGATPRHHARLIDLSRMHSATTDSAAEDERDRRRGFPWRVLLIAWGLAMCIGGGALWMLREASDDVADVPVNDEDATPLSAAECRWENVARSLAVGETTMPMGEDASVVFSYDRMTIRIYAQSSENSAPLRFIRAFGGAQIWHRRTPQSQRDWFFILPRVRNAQRPSLWVLQWNDGEIVSTQRVPLSTETIDHARVDLRVQEGRCLLWVRIEGDQGPGPADKEAWLRLTDPGIVMERGALGGLWTPALEESPF